MPISFSFETGKENGKEVGVRRWVLHVARSDIDGSEAVEGMAESGKGEENAKMCRGVESEMQESR